jgi:DNA polymerase-3 subunit epsilon
MSDLRHLAGGADRFAVVDTETTGVYPSDRIVEIAIVTLSVDGVVLDTWETLVQPNRDVSATHIHGITAAMVADAPSWDDIAGDVAIRLDGACLVAHNAPFDVRMITGEYRRLGGDLTAPAVVDTLRATGGRLGLVCSQFGIPLDGPHRALTDASACGQLLLRTVGTCQQGGPAAVTTARRTGWVLRRDDTVRVALPDPPLIWQLASRIDYEGLDRRLLGYLDLVERVTADLVVDNQERHQLALLAQELGLSDAHVAQAHRRYVNDLIDAALDDHLLTPEEYDQLLRVANYLAVDADLIEQRTRTYRKVTEERVIAPGSEVLFTGDDPERPRAALKHHATAIGLTLARGAGSKRTGLLVAYDLDSRSAKAKLAARYNIPVITTEAFANLHVGETVTVVALDDELATRKVISCPSCHSSWTVAATDGAHSNRECATCYKASPSRQ